MPEARSDELPPAARDLVTAATRLVVTKEYDALERLCGGVRLSAAELSQAVADYGQALSSPPADGVMDIVALSDGSGWSVVVDLHANGERSDLSLELTIVREDGDFRLEVDNVHVR